MMIPPNYGTEYIQQFAKIYPRLAQEEESTCVPFLLEGVAGKRELNQADGLHPTAAGQEIVARNRIGPAAAPGAPGGGGQKGDP